MIRRTSHFSCQSSTCSVREISTFLSSFHVSPFIFPSSPLSTSCVPLVLLHPIAHRLTHPHTLGFISSHTAPNYGVKRSINRKKRGSQHVTYQTGRLERSGGDKRGEEGRRGRNTLLKWKWNKPIKIFHWQLVCISSSAHTDYIYSTLWSNEYVYNELLNYHATTGSQLMHSTSQS